MNSQSFSSYVHGHPKIQHLIASLLLFGLALAPRAYDLARFVTADEAKWVYRSAQFLAAVLRGDFLATSVNLTPAVTTTWLGSIGLLGYYQLNQASLNLPLADWLTSLPEFRAPLDILVATRWPGIILSCLGVVIFYLFTARLFYTTLAFLAAAFVALDPHSIALARVLGHDAPTAIFMVLSLLLILEAVKPGPISWLYLSLSGVSAGLAFLSKAPALFLIPFVGLGLVVSASGLFQKRKELRFDWLKQFVFWLLIAYLTFGLGWPAAWLDPLGRPVAVFQNAFISATDQEEADQEGYWRVPDLGPFYYLVNAGFKLSPLVLVGVGLSVLVAIRWGMGEWANGRMGESAKQRSSEKESGPRSNTIAPPPAPEKAIQPSGPSSPLQSSNSPTLPPSTTCPRTGVPSFQSSPLQSSNPPTFQPSNLPTILWLLTFVLLFTLLMTASDKRSARYILPIFPILAIIAAAGWLSLARFVSSKLRISRLAFSLGLILAALLILWPYAPYYFTYYNPLLGGSFTAPEWVKIGWGEGLDEVGRFLQQQPQPEALRVGTPYASTVAPFFTGKLANPTGPELDYVVLYLKQAQAGEPYPEFIRYYEQLEPSHIVELNGLHYAEVYPGPAIQPSLAATTSDLAAPLGFRPLTPYGRLGQPLTVDVIWPAQTTPPAQAATLILAPLTVLDAGTTVQPLAQAEAEVTRPTTDLAVSRHHLALPADLPRGPYALLVDGAPLGQIELRHFQIPPSLQPLQNLTFGGQIAAVAFQFAPTPDFIAVTVAWQAQRSNLPDYTVFVQLLNAKTNERLAGVDSPPLQGTWPTSRWVKGEVVVGEYLVAIPPDFPAGVYKVIVGLYHADTGQRLLIPDGQDHWSLPYSVIRD
jgi:4-amino-4-deoxy-L-arabinose transferase-like glycosyltransferase